MCKVDRWKGIECYVDADFIEAWSLTCAENTNSVLSRAGLSITHVGVPIFWKIKLQIEIALITCESDNVALSAAMRIVLPLIELSKEIKPFINVHFSMPSIFCQVYEDKKICIAVEESQKNSFCELNT